MRSMSTDHSVPGGIMSPLGSLTGFVTIRGTIKSTMVAKRVVSLMNAVAIGICFSVRSFMTHESPLFPSNKMVVEESKPRYLEFGGNLRGPLGLIAQMVKNRVNRRRRCLGTGEKKSEQLRVNLSLGKIRRAFGIGRLQQQCDQIAMARSDCFKIDKKLIQKFCLKVN